MPPRKLRAYQNVVVLAVISVPLWALRRDWISVGILAVIAAVSIFRIVRNKGKPMPKGPRGEELPADTASSEV
jgi:hypothetical protein